MKTIGLVGGLSYASTLRYYKELNKGVAEQLGGLHSSRMAIVSLDLAEYAEYLRTEEPSRVIQMVADAAQRCVAAGAHFLAISSNTAHIATEAIAERMPGCPMLHIADCTARAVKKRGFSYVGFLGTKYSMTNEACVTGRLTAHNLIVLTPEVEVVDQLQKIIEEELSHGIVNAESRAVVLEAIANFIVAGCEAVILGCTELCLLIQQKHCPSLPLFDSTSIHIQTLLKVQLGQLSLEEVRLSPDFAAPKLPPQPPSPAFPPLPVPVKEPPSPRSPGSRGEGRPPEKAPRRSRDSDISQAGGRLNSRERSTSRDPNGSPSDPETGKRSRGKRERRRQSRQSAERDDGELADKVTRGDPLRSIAEHYDHKSEKIAQETLRDRQQSDLIALRDFHNWIKRELILRHTRPRDTVLDMGCGVGPDFYKFKKAGVSRLVCVDISKNSLDEAKQRLSQGPKLDMEVSFHQMNMAKDDILQVVGEDCPQFDVVTCQFALQYCFKTAETVKHFFNNVTKQLKPGGFFIGTFPLASAVMDVLQGHPKVKGRHFEIVSKNFEPRRFLKGKEPGVGKKIIFSLNGHIDACPEYLVSVKTLMGWATPYDLVKKEIKPFREWARETHKAKAMSVDEEDVSFLYATFVFRKKDH